MSQNNTSKTNTKNNIETEVEVLYQKLGNTWYAFSMVGDDVYSCPISEEQIQSVRTDHGQSNEAV
jgi:hypothetical protein